MLVCVLLFLAVLAKASAFQPAVGVHRKPLARGRTTRTDAYHPKSFRFHAAPVSEAQSTVEVESDIATNTEKKEDLTTSSPTLNEQELQKKGGKWSAVEMQSIVTTALLVTGNTVGAGTLVLPELAAKPGLALSTALFMGAYVVNLLSGLLLAEVAISQHEARSSSSTDPPPSSFREFAQLSLGSSEVANAISAVSLFVNTCALTFSLGKVGVLLSDCVGGTVDHSVLSLVFAALLVLLGSTQSRVRISQVSSMVVFSLFGSVAALLFAGLPQVLDPMGTALAPGTSDNVLTGMLEAAPIMLTTLIFQNIVPPVTRILGYDRTKSVLALVLGSFFPLCLYLSWSFCVLGGGVPTTVGIESPLLTVFSVAAVTGSAIGTTMASSEELQAFLPATDEINQSQSPSAITTPPLEGGETEEDNGYAFPAITAAVLMPLIFSSLLQDYTDALKLSGGYGIPILYGAIPVWMAWTQRKKYPQMENVIPGGATGLVVVGAAFGAFMLNSIAGDFGRIASSI
jgi:tyrosine-specific transport protein